MNSTKDILCEVTPIENVSAVFSEQDNQLEAILDGAVKLRKLSENINSELTAQNRLLASVDNKVNNTSNSIVKAKSKVVEIKKATKSSFCVVL